MSKQIKKKGFKWAEVGYDDGPFVNFSKETVKKGKKYLDEYWAQEGSKEITKWRTDENDSVVYRKSIGKNKYPVDLSIKKGKLVRMK